MGEYAGDYGFVGLGQMGYRRSDQLITTMAKNLRQKIPASSTLYICDISQAIIERFIQQYSNLGSIVVCSSPKEVAEKSDIIVTMLPQGHHVKGVVVESPEAVLKAKKSSKKKLVIDCSTIDTKVSIEVGKAVEESGSGSFSDAAVSGGPVGADAGSLTFMVGADSAETFEATRAVVSMMGKPENIFHCGPVGSGVAVKAINNYLSGVTIIAASEAMNIGVKLGLDPKVLASIINVSSGQCWVTKLNNPVPGVTPGTAANNHYQGGFALELCRKVLDLAVGTADMVGARLVMKDAMLAAYDEALADPRYQGKDARVMYKFLRDEEP